MDDFGDIFKDELCRQFEDSKLNKGKLKELSENEESFYRDAQSIGKRSTVNLKKTPISGVTLNKPDFDTKLPKDIVEQYIIMLNEFRSIEFRLSHDDTTETDQIQGEIELINSQLRNLDVDFESKLKNKVNELILAKIKETEINIQKQIDDIKTELQKALTNKERSLSELNKDLIREELISRNTVMRNFLTDVESIKKEYESVIPDIVKRRVDLDFDLSDVIISRFDVESADALLDRIANSLELCKSRLNADSMHNLINLIFILNVDYIQGFPAYLISLWYIFILVLFATFSFITVPLYLAFICFVSLISYNYERDLIDSYTALLSISKIANKYNNDIDGQVTAEYESRVEQITNKYISTSSILKQQLESLENSLVKAKTTTIPINETTVRDNLNQEIESKRNELNNQLNTLTMKLENIRNQQEQDRLTIENKRKELENCRERLSVFLNPSADKRLQQLIYMNGLFLGFKKDGYTPYYIHHNKRAILLFYNRETDYEKIIKFVLGLYVNNTSYMKDGHCTLDLVDVMNKGMDFTKILPTDDVFDNDAEKINKYPVKLWTNLDDFFKNINEDINTRMNLMPRSGINNIDLFNADRIEKKSKPLAYRVPLFFSYGEGVLSDKNLKFLFKATGASAITDASTNLGIIPILCIPYQYFFKDSIETILKYVDMVGYDNILGLENDLIKLTEKDISEKINIYKKQYDDMAKNLEIK